MKHPFICLMIISLTFISGMRSFALSITSCEKYTVLDSLRYIYGLPDDYFFYPDGDSISARVVGMGKEIVPCLIERITDTTKTQIQISDSCYYTVSDVAIALIEVILNKEPAVNFNFKDLVIKEFYADQKSDIQFSALYHWTFFANSPEINYQNRMRIYNQIKVWYKEVISNSTEDV